MIAAGTEITDLGQAPHVAARDQCLAPERIDAPVYSGRYRRLFPDLGSLQADQSALLGLGRPGGVCAADDCPDAGGEAGWPFFGQFIAHDITADRSPLGHRTDPDQLRNYRTPRANLEGLYADGPVGSPFLYSRADPAKLLLGEGGHDLPRNPEGMALVADARNDSHLFMNQMQVAFITLHNRFVDRLREQGTGEGELFDEARRATVRHYQHVILNEFLPGLIGAELTAELRDGGSRFYRPDGEPYIPFEFADAGYRYGHSQIRDSYQVNESYGPVPIFPALIGFGPVDPARAVDWSLLFDVPGRPPAQRAKRIDGRLAASLISLPMEIAGEAEGSDYASLANRDLQRGETTGLPSGESVAEALGAPVLDPEQVGLRDSGWSDETPLWFYILREADVLADGDRLGPVGARIVGEVLVGIIDADPEVYGSVEQGSTLPSHEADSFALIDILAPG